MFGGKSRSRKCQLMQLVFVFNCCQLMQIRQIASLRDIDQLNVEDESGASGNLAGHPVGPVAHVRGDGELRPLAL